MFQFVLNLTRRVENAVMVEAHQKFVQLTHSVDYFLEHMEVLYSLVEKHRLAEVLSCSLAVVTLGDKQMAQRIDNLVDTEELKRFYLQVRYTVAYHPV
ncbi:hypothetical protein GW17_00036284 [Ensete ventricosum]|nr:hypothetical protein GW17_00036284 [Ensete ventricosum]RZS15182.1 hypothetical protein BHM03_00046987 [Ensete ventricosum]